MGRIPVAEIEGTTYPVRRDLPNEYYVWIGSVIQAHALIELRMQETLFDLMGTEYPRGRVAFAHRDPAVLFKTARDLLDLLGIKLDPSLNLQEFEDEIRSRTVERNNLAHGVWLEGPNNTIALRVTFGQINHPDGRIHVRAFLPELQVLTYDYFRKVREETLATVDRLCLFQEVVKQALAHRSK